MKKKNKKSRFQEGNAAKEIVRLTVLAFERRYPDLEVEKLPRPSPSLLESRGVDLKNKEPSNLGMDPIVMSSICGTVFGDSSLAIHSGYSNARIQFRHSSRQSDWFMWKCCCILKGFHGNAKTPYSSITFQKPDGKQHEAGRIGGEMLGKFKLMSHAREDLTGLHKVLYEKGKKTMKRSWLNHMNAYFLMVLWLDDGGLVGNRQGVISLNSTPFDQCEILVEYLEKAWGINCKTVEVSSKSTKTNQNAYQIVIEDLENLEKLLKIIAPLIPIKSMLYKVCIYYKDSSDRQRWTSELKGLIRDEWHEYLDEYYVYLRVVY